MTRYARDIDGQPVEITGPIRIEVDVNGEPQGFIFTPDAIAALSDDEREAYGVMAITPADAAPAGEVIIGVSLAIVQGQVVETATYVPTPTPQRVPKLYGKLALNGAGLLADIEADMAALPADDDARLYWELATHLERPNAFINGIGAQRGLTADQIDDLFRAAEALRLADGAAA